MKICPNCNTSVVDTAKFCHKCRFNIKKYEEEQSSSPLYCTECGAELPADALFCTECGADVNSGSTVPSTNANDTFNFDAINGLSSMANDQLYEQNGFKVENGVLTAYTGKKRSITIFGSIEEIYDGAFEGNQTVTCIEIEEGIKSIGRRAFASCSSLIEINIPNSCKIIYPDMFEGVTLRTLILTSYKEPVVKCCISDIAKKYFTSMNTEDFVTRKDDKVLVNIEFVEAKAKKLQKEEDDRIAKEKRLAQLKYEEEQKRKKQEEEERFLSKYNVGSTHTMGMYRHPNVKEIEWLVLERNGDKALLVSKYIIDCKKFNETSCATSWSNCTLRKWLNNEFLNVAFSQAEKDKILTTLVKNTDNPVHGTSGCVDTYDKIFLLSIDEVNKYFKVDSSTRCQVTIHAKSNGAYCNDLYFGYWWLRTSGDRAQNASYVFYTGGVSAMGYDVTGIIFGVRPAMWIKLK